MPGNVTVGRATVYLNASSERFTSGVQRAGANLRNHQRQIRATQRAVASFNATVRSLLQTFIIAGGAYQFVQVNQRVEKSLANIIGLVGVAREEVESYRREIERIAASTGRVPAELAEALFFITSAGLRGAAALNVLELSANAATGGLGETKVIADAATSAINAYGSSILSAEVAIGALVAGVREGKVEADSFAQVIGRVTGSAAELGVTFNEVVGIIAGLTRRGLEASEAATGLIGILKGVIRPSQQAAEHLASVGSSVEDIRRRIKSQGLLEVLIDLDKAFANNRQGLTRLFRDFQAVNSILLITGRNAEEFRGIVGALNVSGIGDIEKAYREGLNTIQGQLGRIQAQFQNFLLVENATVFVSLLRTIANNFNLIALSLLALTAIPVVRFFIGVVRVFAAIPRLIGAAAIHLANWFRLFGDNLRKAFADLSIFVPKVAKFITDTLGISIDDLSNYFSNFANTIEGGIESVKNFINSSGDVNSSFTPLSSALEDIYKFVEDQIRLQEVAQRGFEQQTATLGLDNIEREKALRILQVQNALEDKKLDLIQQAAEASRLGNFLEAVQIEESIGILENGSAEVQKIMEAVEAANTAWEENEKRVRAAAEAQARLDRIANRVTSSIGDAFAGLVTGIDSATDAIRNLAGAIISELAQALIAKPIADFLSTFLSPFLNSVFPAGETPTPSPVPTSKRALGGYTPEGLALTGEEGVELLQLNNPGRVYSNKALKSILNTPVEREGNNIVSVNFAPVINGGDPSAIRNELARQIPVMQRIANNAIGEALSRPTRTRSRVSG